MTYYYKRTPSFIVKKVRIGGEIAKRRDEIQLVVIDCDDKQEIGEVFWYPDELFERRFTAINRYDKEKKELSI